jgi:hypothetical protein
MRSVLPFFVALTLLAEAPKPAAPPAAWSYATPRGFHLPEPSYKLPTQIKQALVQFVQPMPQLTKDYQTVVGDKRKFSTWLKGVLLDRKTQLAKAGQSGPTVLSSEFSKLSTGPATITSTTKVRTRTELDLAAIDRYLAVLKAWDPD